MGDNATRCLPVHHCQFGKHNTYCDIPQKVIVLGWCKNNIGPHIGTEVTMVMTNEREREGDLDWIQIKIGRMLL